MSLETPDDVWAWRRGSSMTVALNLSDRPATVAVDTATILVGTDRTRDGSVVRGWLELDPWEAAVLGNEAAIPPG